MVSGPSRVIRLLDIATFESTARYERACELYTDVMELCREFGQVTSVKMPRPRWIEGMQAINEEKDKAERERLEHENFL